MTERESRRMEVYSIHKYTSGNQIKSSWTKIGAAFENNDGSWNLLLHAVPVTNLKSGMAELHMRPPRPREDGATGDDVNDMPY